MTPQTLTSLNPLNQVYRLNFPEDLKKFISELDGLNPLNQVYRLNRQDAERQRCEAAVRLNPLNQVYRLNLYMNVRKETITGLVLIP